MCAWALFSGNFSVVCTLLTTFSGIRCIYLHITMGLTIHDILGGVTFLYLIIHFVVLDRKSVV